MTSVVSDIFVVNMKSMCGVLFVKFVHMMEIHTQIFLSNVCLNDRQTILLFLAYGSGKIFEIIVDHR